MPNDHTKDIAKSLGYKVDEITAGDIVGLVKPLIPLSLAALMRGDKKPKPLTLDAVKVGDKVDIYNKGGSRIYSAVQVTAINKEDNTIRIQGPSGSKALDLKNLKLAKPQ